MKIFDLYKWMLAVGFCLSLIVSGTAGALADNGPRVVVTIKPIHSLVSLVMDGVADPVLLVEGAQSPHEFSLVPSQASELAQADIIFWMGRELETFLEKPLTSLSANARIISFLNDDAKHLHASGSVGDHDHDGKDLHNWLDPVEALTMLQTIGKVMIELDGINAQKYEDNVRTASRRLRSLTETISQSLDPVKGDRFMVFHDAYGSFEKRFGLQASEIIQINPHARPGARRVREIRNRIVSQGIKCVFAEPQFDAKFVDLVIEGLEVNKGVLDPLGANLQPGPDLYFSLISGMAQSLRACLGQEAD